MSTRREFLTVCGKVIGTASLGSILLPVLQSCTPTSMPLGTSNTTKLPVGPDGTIAIDVGDLTESNPVKMVQGLIGPDGKPVLITRVAPEDFRALSMNCTHAGCTVESKTQNGQIPCLCHDSRFALDGSVVKSPATIPLKQYPATYDASAKALHITVPQ